MNNYNILRILIGILIIIFIAPFGDTYTIDQPNITENKDMLSNYTNDTSYKNANIPVESFSASGISFNYPSSWYIHKNTDYMISASKEPGGGDVQFYVQITAGITEEYAIKQSQGGTEPAWTKIEDYKITIDNKTSYEAVYTYDDGKLLRLAQIILIKGDVSYILNLQAPDKEFDKEKPNFAVILNSFKADSSWEPVI